MRVIFKLTIELVPKTSWWNNARRTISPKLWKFIQEDTLAKYKNRCAICKANGKLSCHEEWIYNKKTHTQKLFQIIAICQQCHYVKHIGQAYLLASKGIIDITQVINHFMKVNKCSREQFESYREETFAQWRERSKYKWKIDITIIEKYKDSIETSSGPTRRCSGRVNRRIKSPPVAIPSRRKRRNAI